MGRAPRGWGRLALALALAFAGAARGDEIPALYREVAARHGLAADALYRLALRASGRRSRFAAAPAPWPWTLRLCAGETCETVYPASREAMARAMDAGRAAGLSLYLGPLGLPWDSAPDLPARAATSPRVTLNEAARRLALALAASRADLPGAAAISGGGGSLARRWGPLVDRVAREEGLDPALAHAVVAVESAYNPAAVSPKGAAGLMQLMPATAERFGLPRERRGEPEANLRAGMRYLKWLLDYFGRDFALAVAGYNAGEGAVLKHGRKIPPYPETRSYVARVARQLARRAAPSLAHAGERP